MVLVINTSSLTGYGFAILGDDTGDQAGWSVSSAGDVNGDGYDDILVGAPFGDRGAVNGGQAYLIFGKSAGSTTIDLDALAPADGFEIRGAYADDWAGFSVSSAGDMNGDGFDEIIVGAPTQDQGGDNRGAAYVLLGKASGFATIELASLSAADGFTIQGDADYDWAGASVSDAGDINGDGYDDLIVGAHYGDNGGDNAGEAYVIFGKASGLADIDLGALSAADGFVIQGAEYDQAGWSVSSAGDVNNDGFDDIVVGALLADAGAESAVGKAYVIFGKSTGFANIDLAALAAADGFVIQGDAPDDHAGFSVSSAGDINGDGFDDIAVGARDGDNGGSYAGEVYVIFGKASGFSSIDLSSLAPADGFVIQGSVSAGNGDRAGRSVSSAGDVNGDGFDDLLIGAPYYSPGNRGDAYVIFGKAGGFGTVDLASLATADGFIVRGDGNGDQAGWSVSSAGDVDGDGFDDIVVGSRYAELFGTNQGQATIIFGRADLTEAPVLADLDGDAASFTEDGSAVLLDDSSAPELAASLTDDETDLDGGTLTVSITGGGTPAEDVLGLSTAGTVTLSSGTAVGSIVSVGGAAIGTISADGNGGDDLVIDFDTADATPARISDLIRALTYANGNTIEPSPAQRTIEIIVDGGEVNSAAATVTVDVVAADDLGSASPDAFSIDETDTIDDADLLANDSDIDDPLTVIAVNGVAGNVGVQQALQFGGLGTITSGGLFDYDTNGQFGYLISAATAAATGAVNTTQTENINYTIGGGDSATATVTINGIDSLDDELWGDIGDNIINDTVGIDYFNLSQSGTDTVNGQGGDDVIYFGATFTAADQVDGGSGNDTLTLDGDYGSTPLALGASSLANVERIELLPGSPYEITFNDANVAAGMLLTVDGTGLGSFDTIFVDGSAETDGRFILIGDFSFDDLRGGAGDDVLKARGGINFLDGNLGIDTADYSDAPGAVDVDLGAGTADNGWGGSDQLEDIENVIGSAFGDELQGSNLNNRLDGGGGADQMLGGNGSDTYVVDHNLDQAIESSALDGMDTIESSISFTLGNHLENLVLIGSAAINGTGNGLSNLLTGNTGDNMLDGGSGVDTMTGGDGDDLYIVDTLGDLAIEASEFGGADTVQSSVGYTLGANLETLVLTGTAAISGGGNALNNTLFGNSAVNTLTGGLGADSMRGGGGDDTYNVDEAGDLAIEVAAGDGTDTVRSSITYILGGNLENLILTGAAAINGTGNAGVNTLTGNSAANTLNGGAGADSMRGGDGDDFYLVDNAGDLVIETSALGGTDTVQSSVSFTLGGNVENLTLIGTAANGTGNALANVITGNSQANFLNGGTGADTMTGGLGNDTYQVDNVGDQAVEASAGGGTDLVQSSVTFTLGQHVDNLTLSGSAAINGTGNGTANTITGNGGNNVLEGLGGNDTINAGNGADTLRGGANNDTLDGSTGDDDLYGGAGNDTMTGGSGADDYFFDTALNAAGNVDAILGYSVALDTIFLDDAIFTTLAGGTLAAGAFRNGTVAVDADDSILYDSATGQIRYDADGAGGGAAVLFATVTPGLALTNADFVVY